MITKTLKNFSIRQIDRSIDELREQESSTGKTSKLMEVSMHIDSLSEVLRLLQGENEILFNVSTYVTVDDYELSQEQKLPESRKTKKGFWISENLDEKVDIYLRLDNCASRSEFVENALRFYIGYLNTKNAGGFLPEALSAMLTGTLDTYRRNIAFLYDALPEDKPLRPGTLDRWQRDLLAEGYSPRTVNTRLPVANPRCLKRLWQATQDSVRAQLDTLVEQACISLLETEQLSIGWDSSRGVRGP